MPIFIDPRGHTNFGIGLCARCSRKFPLDELYSDPNYPGLKVCIDDLDQYDPYRLPARPPDQITLPFTRPDVPLTDTTPTNLSVYYLITEDGDPLLTEDDYNLLIEAAP